MNYTEAVLKIKKANHPEDLFSLENHKNEYKNYSRLVHPDLNGNSQESVQISIRLNGFYDSLKVKIEENRFGVKVIAEISSKNSSYVLTDVLANGSLSTVYDASDNVIKVVRNKVNNDLLLAESKNLKDIKSICEKNKIQSIITIPELTDTFLLDGKQINVFKNYKTFYTLRQVLEKYPNGVEAKHAVWMFNRLLTGLYATHYAGYVHAALSLDNFIIEPESHGGKLLDFCFSVKNNLKLKAKCAETEYPVDVDEFKTVDFSTDIYCASKIFQQICKNIPVDIERFLRYLQLGRKHRPNNVYEVFEEFQEILRKLYGEPKFHQFKMEF